MGGKSQKDKKKKKKETLGKSAKMTGRRRVCECLICSVPRGASSQAASTRGRSQPIGIILRRVQEARKQEKKKGKEEKKRNLDFYPLLQVCGNKEYIYTLMLF